MRVCWGVYDPKRYSGFNPGKNVGKQLVLKGDPRPECNFARLTAYAGARFGM